MDNCSTSRSTLLGINDLNYAKICMAIGNKLEFCRIWKLTLAAEMAERFERMKRKRGTICASTMKLLTCIEEEVRKVCQTVRNSMK